MDIRQFFNGLSIPEGGVHIVGGELGDAFIAFSTDEDARQAFNLTNGRIKEVQIKLMLSSRTEMQKVIEAARSQSMAAFIGTPALPAAPIISTPAPPLIAPPPPSLSTPSQPTPTSQMPLTIPPAPLPPTLGSMRSLLPAMVPDVQPFGDANVQNQQLQQQQKLLQQQLQQVQQQQQQAADSKESSSSKDSNSRDRRRSRSRSHERRDRKRGDRRRSRSRSRERRDRRRRDRSRSRDRRSTSRDRDRRSRDSSSRKSAENKTKSIGVWENPPPIVEPNLLQNQATLQLLGSLIPNANLLNLDPAVVSLLPAALDPWVQAMAAPELQLINLPMNNDNHNRSANELIDSASDNKSNSRERDRDRARDNGRDRERDRDHDRDRNRNRDRDRNTDRNTDRNPSLDGSNDTSRNKSDDSRRNSNRNSRSDGEKDCCIRVFPYYGGFSEIRRFFNGLFIHNNGIKFALSSSKEQTGVALIKFVCTSDKEKALERNGQPLKGMELQISNLSDEDFENGTDPQPIANLLDIGFESDPFTCLIMLDLPPFTTNHHLLKLFSDYSVLNIYIVHKHRGPSMGYVKFNTTEDAHKALDDKARHSIEGRRIRVGPCKEEIFEGVRKQQEGDKDQGSPSKLENDGATSFLLLTDIPQKSSDRDIADFFSDVGIVPANIYMVRDENGIFNGETYCEFFSVEEARVAFQKKGMPMGSCTVSIAYVTKQFMDMNIKIINVPNDNNMGHNGPRLPLINPLLGGPGVPGILGMPMMPRPFFPRGGMHRGGPGMGMPMGPRGMMRGMPRPPMNMHPRMNNIRFPRGPHPMQQQQSQQQSQQQQYDDDEEIAPPGCTLLMENVPFKAELEEILDFFDGFDVSPDNVLRKYDIQGRPSGETKIIFNSPEEVFHILQEKRGTKIRDRLIYLSQC